LEDIKFEEHLFLLYFCINDIEFNMIRTYITPTKTEYNLVLNLPDDYLGTEIEIIAFKRNEEVLIKSSISEQDFEVPEWHKKIVLERIKNAKETDFVDASKVMDDLEAEFGL